MRAYRLAPWLWFIVAATYATRACVEIAAGDDPVEDVVAMLTAPVLMKLYRDYCVWGYGTGFCGCKEYCDRDELERTFCSEIRGTRYCKYFANSRRR